MNCKRHDGDRTKSFGVTFGFTNKSCSRGRYSSSYAIRMPWKFKTSNLIRCELQTSETHLGKHLSFGHGVYRYMLLLAEFGSLRGLEAGLPETLDMPQFKTSSKYYKTKSCEILKDTSPISYCCQNGRRISHC